MNEKREAVCYQAQLEAILFASGDPIPIARLADILGITPSACRQQLEVLAKIGQDPERGVELLFLEDAVQLATKAEFSESVQKALSHQRNLPLTPVAMEVLAIIAYNQPVTRGFIEQVRGVNSNQVVNTLLDKGLIEEAGRLNLPGRPISYRTTAGFLRSFSLQSLHDLPPIHLPDEEQLSLSEVSPPDAEVLL